MQFYFFSNSQLTEDAIQGFSKAVDEYYRESQNCYVNYYKIESENNNHYVRSCILYPTKYKCEFERNIDF